MSIIHKHIYICLLYIDLHLCTQISDFLFLLLDRVFLSIPRCLVTGYVGFKLKPM